MNEINLVLSLEETNEILTALGHQPYIKVHQLISNIQTQAGSQLQSVQNGSTSEGEKVKTETSSRKVESS